MDLVCKRNATSLVWAYFGFKADEYGKPRDIRQVVCRLCRRIIQHKGGNTTNLRSHLKNKHPTEFSELILVTPPAMVSEIQDGEIGQEDNGEDLPVAQPGLNQNYVPDQALPCGDPWLHGGPSKAVSSLPSCLRLWKGPGSASWAGAEAPHYQEAMSGDIRVYAQTPLQQGWMFGPYVGELSNGPQNTLKYAWAIREGEDFLYINGYDENNSNWMRYVAYASKEEEHNVTVLQFYRQIYYRVSKPVPAGAELKVWIGKDYASMLGLVADDSLKFELNDKEWILKIFQDIQAVPVGGASAASCSEQGSASSTGSDNCSSSQSQSHMADISDVAGVPKAPAINSPQSSSSPACPSPTPAKLMAPTDLFASRPQLGERYDFIPGAEMLIKSPQAAIQRVWYFFGFEPDPTGMPLDRSTVVCKLCGEKMGFKGGPGDLQNHLTTKHHMQSRDVNKEVRCLTYPQYKACFTAMAPGQSSSPQISYCRPMSPATEASSPSIFKPGMGLSPIFSAHLTDAIINFLIRDLQPVCVVEGEGFQQLIDCLNPACGKLPSVDQLDTLLTELHNKGRKALAKQLKRPCEESADIQDQTTLVKPRGRGRPRALGPREVPYAVALSADVWSHAWQGRSERHTTVWAHWVDPDDFTPHNVALSSQPLGGSGPDEAEARVRAVGVGWGILHPSLVLLSSEARGKGGAGVGEPGDGDRAEGGGAPPHPNSTTFLERQDSGSSDEMSALERGCSPSATSAQTTHSPPTIPCFFTAVQACVEEATSHLVISRILDQFQKLIATLLTLQDQNQASPGHPTERQSRVLPRKELQSWADGQPSWAQLYGQLKIILQHQTLLSEVIREVREETQTKGEHAVSDAACSVVELDDRSKVKSVCDPAAPPAMASSGGIVPPRRSDWKVLEELCSVLKPLDVACRTLASEKFPRLSLVKPVLTGLLTRHLVTPPRGASPLFKEVKRRMRQTLVGRYGDPEVNRVLCVACALDPQFKGLSFMELKDQMATFDSLKDEAVKTIKVDRTPSKGRPKKRGSALQSSSSETNVGCPRRSKRLKEAPTMSFREAEEEEEEDGRDIKEEKEEEEVGSNLKQEYDEEDEEEEESDWEASDKEEETSEPALSGMEFLLGDLFSSPPPTTQTSMEESVDMELSVYRADKGAWLGKDPLQWWNTKAGQLPILAKVACGYLAAPAVVGGAVEAYLGEDEGAMHRKRANIPPQSLDEILFLHHNRITTGNSQE